MLCDPSQWTTSPQDCYYSNDSYNNEPKTTFLSRSGNQMTFSAGIRERTQFFDTDAESRQSFIQTDKVWLNSPDAADAMMSLWKHQRPVQLETNCWVWEPEERRVENVQMSCLLTWCTSSAASCYISKPPNTHTFSHRKAQDSSSALLFNAGGEVNQMHICQTNYYWKILENTYKWIINIHNKV